MPRWLVTALVIAAGVLSLAWGFRVVGGGHDKAQQFNQELRSTAIALGAALMVLGVIFNRVHAHYARRMLDSMIAFGSWVDVLSPRRKRLDLLLASLLALFLEVTLIRWHGTEFRACAYFKNITLLACFLGLGLGFARARRAIVGFPMMLVMLVLQVLFMDVLSLAEVDQAIRNPFTSEVFWGLGGMTHIVHFLVFYGFFTALFVSTIVIFIPIGQLTGRLMDPARPLSSYTINIVGSILGVVLFGLVSYLWLPPSIWFGFASALGLYLVRMSRGGLAVSGCAVAVMLAWIGFEPRADVRDIYSPYQRLEVKTDNAWLPDGRLVKQGVWVSANKTYYMQGFNLSDEFVARWKDQLEAIRHKSLWYNLPYRFKSSPGRVLVVGAGAGNDVAAAVRNGAKAVDAVEIDPAIRWVGENYHPESPYQAPGVRKITNDARAFMKRSHAGVYDLVVFGLLDSHTLLSGMSSIRLDNFVYTKESMAEAKRCLAPGGLVCLSFAVGPESPFSARIYKMLSVAFGHPPRTFGFEGQDTMFIIGVNPADVAPAAMSGQTGGLPVPETTTIVAATAGRLDPPPAEDDWPFPFLPGRKWEDFPMPYIYLMAILAMVSVIWVLGTAERGTTLDPHFFFLGGAFLLIETKGITELALVFGTTWIVASVVITAILTLILLANWTVHLTRPTRPHISYVCLILCLLAGYLIPVHSLLDRGWLTAAVGSSILLCLPLYFAGIVFATSLQRAASLPSAFASNLLGAILGGLCEYLSMVTGFRALYLAGMALYALSWVCLAVRRREVPASCPVQARV